MGRVEARGGASSVVGERGSMTEKKKSVSVSVSVSVQGWTERSVGFGKEHFTLQGRTFTTVAPSSLIR